MARGPRPVRVLQLSTELWLQSPHLAPECELLIIIIIQASVHRACTRVNPCKKSTQKNVFVNSVKIKLRMRMFCVYFESAQGYYSVLSFTLETHVQIMSNCINSLTCELQYQSTVFKGVCK